MGDDEIKSRDIIIKCFMYGIMSLNSLISLSYPTNVKNVKDCKDGCFFLLFYTKTTERILMNSYSKIAIYLNDI